MAVVVAGFFVSACSKSEGDVSGLINNEHLGNTVDAFEEVAGAPIQEHYGVRVYEHGGCEFKVHEAGGRVQAFSAPLNQACSFDLDDFLFPDEDYDFFDGAVFADVGESLGGGLYYVDCLRSCGGAYDPAIRYHWNGPRALGFVEVMVSTEIVDDKAIEAADALSRVLVNLYGEDWVIDAKFNCAPREILDEAEIALGPVEVERIKIGYDVYQTGC